MVKKSYKFAWAAVEAGDPADFAVKLKNAMYYTAPVEDYIKGLRLHFDRFMKNKDFESIMEELNKEPTPTEWSNVSDMFFKENNE